MSPSFPRLWKARLEVPFRDPAACALVFRAFPFLSSCAVCHASHRTEPGLVLTLGQGDVGQLGLGEDVMERKRPALVQLPEKIIQAEAGGMHTVCLSVTGKVSPRHLRPRWVAVSGWAQSKAWGLCWAPSLGAGLCQVAGIVVLARGAAESPQQPPPPGRRSWAERIPDGRQLCLQKQASSS